MHWTFAISTQLRSHDVSQQPGSCAQTAWQHAVSEHPGCLCGKAHESFEAVHGSLAHSQAPDCAGLWAIRTQVASHLLAQQNGSMAHTARQQVSSEQ